MEIKDICCSTQYHLYQGFNLKGKKTWEVATIIALKVGVRALALFPCTCL